MANTNEQGPALVSMAQQFTGLPMGSLIGGPLMAAAQANHQMAMSQVDFLMKTCFSLKSDKDAKNDEKIYEPTLIKMKLTRGVITPADDNNKKKPSIQNIETTITLPILTILPLNSLAVDNVDVSFIMEVSSCFSEDQSKESILSTHEDATLDASIGWGPFKVEIKGNVSHDQSSKSSEATHYDKKNSATYKVDVHAGQLPLPPGVGVIIQAYTNNISPIQLPTQETKQ
jgi:hypothetical protein